MNRIRGGIEESKEISPMFPRLHVKDAEKGGPKAPPRNKMALYEQFSIPSQSFASGSASLFPLPLRNYTGPPSSSHISCNQSIQFTSNAPSILAEKGQPYNSRRTNLTKYTQDNFINSSKNPLKELDGEDVFITSRSANGKSSCFSIIQNNKDEDKLAGCNLSCSFKSMNSFRKKVNSPAVVDLKSAQYGKIQMEELSKVNQNGPKPEEVLSLDGFGDLTDASLISLVKCRDSKSSNKEHRSSKDEIRSISVDSLKTLQGSSVHTHEEHAAFGDKINSRDRHIEKPAASDVHKCSGELEIGSRFFLEKGAGNEDEETSVMHISPDNVVGAIGEQQFWKARRTIVNQQKIFVMQVFELHRLIKVQRLIAGSPHILLVDNLLLTKPPPKTSTTKKFQSDFDGEKPSSVVKLDSKSGKATTAENATNSAVGKIPIPCVNNITKGHANQLSSYGHHLGNLPIASSDTNSKQSPSYVYPPPPGNQWLVPVMSPSEGLVYKPVIGPCPPNAGFMAPIYGTCGSVSFNPLSKDASSEAALAPSSHQKLGILSGSSLPQFLPPPFIHNPSSIAASAVEQMGQSNGPENHNSCGEVNSAILYQSSSTMSSPTSQVMSRNVSTYHSPKDKEPQRSTASSPSKRMSAGEVLPLFPLAPTFLQSEDRNTQVELQPRVIKAMPHNPKSASESAARIFRSIQEERKHL
ncbi:unnamed protein product [Sphenostylis stenocarpa]|uniref:ELF3-like protein 2 n=1 Tax=Sphenostylis stenocarpa TaxID=92480 RepID=A0AA86VGG7_9FABA|nr:unnamed protein product [Sphenostylis stenocarpa]